MFGKKDSDSKRFEVTYEEKGLNGLRILVDKETGVNYLYCWDGYTGGLTVLLNKDGTPATTPISKDY